MIGIQPQKNTLHIAHPYQDNTHLMGKYEMLVKIKANLRSAGAGQWQKKDYLSMKKNEEEDIRKYTTKIHVSNCSMCLLSDYLRAQLP